MWKNVKYTYKSFEKQVAGKLKKTCNASFMKMREALKSISQRVDGTEIIQKPIFTENTYLYSPLY